MKFLLIVKQKKNIDTFEGVVAALLNDGHAVTLAIQQRDAERDMRLSEQFEHTRFELAACPEQRADAWRSSAPLLRSVRDWAQYFRPSYTTAVKLRQRAADRLLRELGASDHVDVDALTLGPAAAARLQATLTHIELMIPSDTLHEEFLAQHQPDVVLVTPGLHFGSGQTDFIKSARARGIPVWMLLFSWDNLSTKGALHAEPDLMFVWNERQRREVAELHDFPSDRVVVVGAPRFDEFFRLRSVVSRETFFAPLGLDPERPMLLYLCSSRFIAEQELGFIRKWLDAVRGSQPNLRDCNVVVRPHPDIALVRDEIAPPAITWSEIPQAMGWVQRPFDDPGAVVLRTTYRTQQAFFECLYHSQAVVALNTSAELEAGIAGRPVFTVLANDEGADGQANTIHFNYLLKEHGGFVVCAPDLPTHIRQLSETLAGAPNTIAIRQFIMQFLRPCGDIPVSELLARTLVEYATKRAPARVPAKSSEPQEAADRAAKTLVIGNSSTKVFATPETRRWRRKGVLSLDPAAVAWLNEKVRPGDVVYDIGAGVGAYSIFAAVQRGALAVAFEPGFGAFKGLCDNVLLNDCARTIMPLPIALGERTGLLELHYSNEAGDDHHSLRLRRWQTKRDSLDSHYAQPVCAERLDDVVARHRLPAPNVIRIAVWRGVEAVLGGARTTLRTRHLRSILITVKNDAQAESVMAAARGTGYSASASSSNGDYGIAVRLERANALRAPGISTEQLRRVAERFRRLW